MVLQRFPVLLLAMCATFAAGAQSTTPPPVKMGLWETTVTSQMSGFQLPPDVVARLKAMGRSAPGGPHTAVSQGCLTPEEWQKSMEKMSQPASGDCTITHRQMETRKFSVDVSCKSEHGGTTTGHWEIQATDDEHSHGSGHMASDAAGPNGQHFTMDMTINSHFVSASCGDVKPGSAKIIRHD